MRRSLAEVKLILHHHPVLCPESVGGCQSHCDLVCDRQLLSGPQIDKCVTNGSDGKPDVPNIVTVY